MRVPVLTNWLSARASMLHLWSEVCKQSISGSMEVTSKNFKDVLPHIQTAIDQSDFISIDTELTGLGTNECRPHALDLPEERYQKLRKGAMEFHIIQFGLATFKYDTEKEKYMSNVFNFYIFPRPFSRQAPDVRFTCQASSIDFLCSHDFDFNKCFKQGITYLRPDHADKLKQVLKEKHEAIKSMQQMASPGFSSPCVDGSQPVKGPISIPEEQKPFIEDICEKVESYINSSEDALSLPPVNGFLRKLTYQTVNMKFGSQVHLQTKTNETKRRYIEIRRVGNKKDVEELERIRRQTELDEIDDATGFTKVINMLALSRKVIIGHNMLLDVMHTLHRFRCSLPDSYEEFKSLTHCIFPRLLDTKLMASYGPLKDVITNTGLGELKKLLEGDPFSKPVIEFEENFGYSNSDEKYHDAGYDAYITGYCFLAMANYLGTKEKDSSFFVTKDSPLLETYVNKIYLMWVYDIRFINIAGKDGPESRSHIFYLTFPSDWRNNDLNELFSSFGSIYVTWIDDSSAFVSLQNRGVAQLVMSQLSPGENYNIMPYSEYKEKKALSTLGPASVKMQQRVPASDVQLPSKRKRSLDGTPSISSRRSITTIAEEDETMEEDQKKEDEEDTGVPLKRKKVEEKNGSADKVFEEPATW